MKLVSNPKFLAHNPDSFAEGPYRIEAFMDSLEERDRDGEQYISLVHPRDHLRLVREACKNRQVLAEVQLSPESYEAACLAVGLTISASEQGDFAVVRPPGHHAKQGRADGFCLFNNMAIAAQKLVNEGKKVFILDIDGHHGDGTQGIFYDSDRVLFCSVHQQNAYPWTGRPDETGTGRGKGYTMNFPLPAGSGDPEFLAAVDAAIEKAQDFKPDVVGVSAGFDGYQADRLLGLNYTLNGYYRCGSMLGYAFDHVFAVLEGGYHLEIRDCAEHFIRGLCEKW